MPIMAIAVTPTTIRRIRVLSLSAVSMPSAASSSTASQPTIEMRPRSAAFRSRVGIACRLADTYDADDGTGEQDGGDPNRLAPPVQLEGGTQQHHQVAAEEGGREQGGGPA